MKKVLSIFCCTILLLTFAGCEKREPSDSESAPQSASSIDTSVSENSSENVESSAESSDKNTESTSSAPSGLTLQKISELRGDIENQVNTVKNAEYGNLHFTEDFVVKVPDTDMLYDLTFTKRAPDFEKDFEFFDKTFDREFGDIYTQEDKEKLYHVAVMEEDLGAFNSDSTLLVKHIDKLRSGEYTYSDIYVYTDKAYLTIKPQTTGIHGLNHDGTIKRAKDEDRKVVALSFGTDYFDIVKNYLDVDSEDRYEILDGELSVKEAAETAKKIVSENKYGWGGALDPDVYQIKVLDIGEGKYGFSITMTPSYKGVLFDSYEFPKDPMMNTRVEKLDHNYYLLMPRFFMMEKGKFDSFTGIATEFSVTEDAEYDSVISFENAIQMLSEKFGEGMELSLSRAELIYTGMYRVNEEEDTFEYVEKSFPVWKFHCHNTTDNFKYIIYVNAINGNVKYYITDWWEI